MASRIAAGVRLSLVFTAAGLVLGLGWTFGAPWARSLTDRSEAIAAGDAAFAVCAVALGVVTAAMVAIWPGSAPATRVAVVVGLAAMASLLGWGVGITAHAPELRARGVVLLWPLVVSLLTMARALVAVVFARSV